MLLFYASVACLVGLALGLMHVPADRAFFWGVAWPVLFWQIGRDRIRRAEDFERWAGAKSRVTVQSISVTSDDPDRFVFSCLRAFEDASRRGQTDFADLPTQPDQE